MLHPGTRRRIDRRTLLAGAASASLFPAIRAEAQTAGVALVIGNSKYSWEASLPNVKRDTPDIARAFQALGLKTEFVQDADKDTLHRAIDRFAAASRGSDLSVFYFAGHGVTWENESYIVPVDADLTDPANAKKLTQVRSVLEAMKEAAHRFLIFDSCQNNPADGWKQRARRAQTLQSPTASKSPRESSPIRS